MAKAWVIRIRCPKGFGVNAGGVEKISLPLGADTPISDFRTKICAAAKVAPAKLCVRGGFPPRIILSDSSSDEDKRGTVSAVGLNDRDTVIVERLDQTLCNVDQTPPRIPSSDAAAEKPAPSQGEPDGARAGRKRPALNANTMATSSKNKRVAGVVGFRNKGKRRVSGSSRHRWGSGTALGDSPSTGQQLVSASASADASTTSHVTDDDHRALSIANRRYGDEALNTVLSLMRCTEVVMTRQGAATVDNRTGAPSTSATSAPAGNTFEHEFSAQHEVTHGATWDDFYFMIVSELLYAFRDDPERSTEFDEEWIRTVLRESDFDLSDLDSQDSSDVNAMLKLYEDAAEYYEKYEEFRLANAIVEQPEYKAKFDVPWIRTVLGYAPAPSGVTDPDAIAYAEGVWRDMWETAVLSADMHAGAGSEHGAAQSSTPDGTLASSAAGASVSTTGAGNALEQRVRLRVKQRLGFNLKDIVDPSALADSTKDPIDTARDVAGAGLVAAMSAAGDNGVKKAFQTALRSREAEADAEAKVQATLGGSVSIAVCHTVTPQGQQEEYLTVTYKKQRTSVEETVQYIPELLLVAILESLTESDDSNEHNRLHPVAMALMSPRVFWNVVRCANIGMEALESASLLASVCINCMHVHVPTVTHTELTFAGPDKSFEQGCRELAPELNWTRVFERTRKLKYSSLEWAQ
eukprot:m.803400 g.803400  ORF g.803400 m.803400 type:complete len:692 (+) comp23365_c0_seq3:164-2239(+)